MSIERVSYTLIIAQLFFIAVLTVYGQDTSSVKKSWRDAFEYEFGYKGDFLYNAIGGIKQGGGYLGKCAFMLTYNFQKIHLLKGTQCMLQCENTHGLNPSETYTGDWQGFNNITNGNYSYIAQFYLRKRIHKSLLQFGLCDWNAHFSVTNSAAELVNSSFGVPSVLALSTGVPIFPRPTLALEYEYDISSKFEISTAIHDGYAGSFDNDPYNIDWSISPSEGFISTTELCYNNKRGQIKSGICIHTAQCKALTDSNLIFSSNYAIYTSIDQEILTSEVNPHASFTMFSQCAIAPSIKNSNDFYISFGARYKGFWHKYPENLVVIGYNYAHRSAQEIHHDTSLSSLESVVELSYVSSINSFITIQPDIQYIISPGATIQHANALVGLIRINMIIN